MNIQDKISKIIKEIESAFKKQPIVRNDFIYIITQIHTLLPIIKAKEKNHLKNIYEELGNELFERNITLPEYDISLFEEKERSQELKNVKEEIDLEILFSKKFKELVNCIEDRRKILRRHIFLRFTSKDFTNIKILLLHDSYSKSQLFNEIKNRFKNDCIISDVEKFVNDLKTKENEYHSCSFICFLVLSPGTISASKIQELIEEISKSFLLIKIEIDFERISEEDFFILTGSKEDIIEELKSKIGIELLNSSLPNEMTDLITKLFKDNACHTLSYKILTGGFSGSTVLELSPFTELGESDRLIIKIGEKKLKSIREELNNHKYYVELHDAKNYQIKVIESEKYIAILYTYASSDSTKESKPFSRIYKDLNAKELSRIIDFLFTIKLFNKWNKSENRETNKYKLFELYESYLKKDKLFENIIKINAGKNNLVDNIEKVFAYSLETSTKVCHGDLHSENFFFDGEKIFLIDFGHTQKCHALIDYTTLECAIKFRLIPFYIPVEDLLEIEKELISTDTFDQDYSFKRINRDDLTKPFKIINQIRYLSKSLFLKEDDPVEYLISLFMITLRQISYPDVNQLYALRSAEVLIEHILSEISKRDKT